MTCEQSRELLLEADVEAIRGDIATPLAEHLHGCADCRHLAALILAEHDQLARAFGEVERRYVQRAPRRMIGRRLAAVLLPAAAAVAMLLLFPPDDAPAPLDPQPAELYAALYPRRPLIEPPPGTNAAVVTTDRAVTLVLLYQGEGR